MGAVRHEDAEYEQVIETVRRNGIQMPV